MIAAATSMSGSSLTSADTDRLIRQFVGGDTAAIARLVEQARTWSDQAIGVARNT